MKPVIGITASLEDKRMSVHRDYSDAILRAGGFPVILPYTKDEQEIRLMADEIDGLLLTGGEDIDPTLFGEQPLPGLGWVTPERDALEMTLSRAMLQANKPILAVCRGCQILNIAAGGDMYQDLYSQREGVLQHTQQSPREHGSHTLQIAEHSLLHRITGQQSLNVNSFHHQAVRELAKGFVVTAITGDGVVEAFESRNHAFVLAVQWHPEGMASGDEREQRLFDALVEAGKGERE